MTNGLQAARTLGQLSDFSRISGPIPETSPAVRAMMGRFVMVNNDSSQGREVVFDSLSQPMKCSTAFPEDTPDKKVSGQRRTP